MGILLLFVKSTAAPMMNLLISSSFVIYCAMALPNKDVFNQHQHNHHHHHHHADEEHGAIESAPSEIVTLNFISSEPAESLYSAPSASADSLYSAPSESADSLYSAPSETIDALYSAPSDTFDTDIDYSFPAIVFTKSDASTDDSYKYSSTKDYSSTRASVNSSPTNLVKSFS